MSRARSSSGRPSVARAMRPVGLALVVGVPLALLVEGVAGLVVGAVLGAILGVLGDRWLTRQPSRAEVAVERRVAADLPFAVDLLAAALRAGATPDMAARCVGKALGGPLGERLLRVDRALGLGAPAGEAWSYLGTDDGVKRIARAAERSQQSGAAFAQSLLRIADELRSDSLLSAESAARRAAVLIVLPLGLCFLPSFVLAGLVPVIVAILGDVLSP